MRAGELLGVVQIAGLIARRIICDVQEGQKVVTGGRFGMIRFGSRTDIYLPHGVQPLVSVGQYMLGGETVLADCASNEAARAGEIPRMSDRFAQTTAHRQGSASHASAAQHADIDVVVFGPYRHSLCPA